MSTVLRQINNWSLIYDRLHGVTTIYNSEMNFYRSWNTGLEAQEEIANTELMTDEEFLEYCVGESSLRDG